MLYDPFDAESLVLGFRVPNVGTAEKAAAAKKLTDMGLDQGRIAVMLDVSERTVSRFVNQFEVVPLPPVEDEDWGDDWPTCKNGHTQTPDNVGTGGRCKMCQRNRRRSRENPRAA